jgi:Tfp pilus assembly protein PilF
MNNHRSPSLATSARALVLLAAALLAACAAPPPPAPPPPPPPVGLAELMERPAERALVEGIRLYDNGQYEGAEAALQRALSSGLASARDQASAHKLIAFISCTSAREAACEAAFRAALAADPAFALSRAEAGHPMWGPVYRRVRTP